MLNRFASWIRVGRFGLFLRGHLASWPGYQHVPDTGYCHNFRLRLRAAAALFSSSIRENSDVRARRRKIIKLHGSYKGELLILGNGPSVNNLSLNQILRFQGNGGRVLVMNSFLFSELSKQFLPDFYVVIDPAYWDIESTEDHKLRLDLQSYLSSVNPTCLLIQTATNDLLCPNHINTFFVDGRSVAGLMRWSKPNRPWGLPSSVALTSISTMKYLGFETIYFAGLDSSSYLNFFVDDLNQVKYTAANTYFYSESDGDPFNPSKAQDMGVRPIRHMADVFYAAAIFSRDFKDLSAGKCINVGNDRTNDASPRACLLG